LLKRTRSESMERTRAVVCKKQGFLWGEKALLGPGAKRKRSESLLKQAILHSSGQNLNRPLLVGRGSPITTKKKGGRVGLEINGSEWGT